MEEERGGGREKTVEQRERGVREREDKVVEFEQAIDKRERALDQRGYELEERSKRGEEEVPLNLMVLTRPVWHLVGIYGPLLFFDLSSFICWATRRLHSSFAPALPPPPARIFPPPPPQTQDPDATGKSDAIYRFQQVNGGITSYSWALACVPLC